MRALDINRPNKGTDTLVEIQAMIKAQEIRQKLVQSITRSGAVADQVQVNWMNQMR
jgi:hypothetical protein